jgi:integrase
MIDSIAGGKTAKTVKTPRGKAIVTGGAIAAARVSGLLGGIFTWGAKRGLAPELNPAHGVERTKGEPRDRILSPAELTALGNALETAPPRSRAAARAVELIALTGMRRTEAAHLRWGEVDADAHMLRLTSTKTGVSVRPISNEALRVLATIPRHAEFVFPNRRKNGSADLEKAIAHLFNAAGLFDARSHDLRRTFASTAAELGLADSTIGALLGHARRGVTVRFYVRHVDATLIAAADRVSGFIANLLDTHEK